MATTQFRQDINLLGVGQLTNVRIHNVTASELATLATQLTVDNTGMIVFNVDDDTSYVWEGASFVANSGGGSVTAPVTSVAGKIGAVVLTSTDVGLANVDNTSDVDKPVSTAQQVAIDAKEDEIVKSIGYAAWDGTGWIFKNESYAVLDDIAPSASTTYSSLHVDGLLLGKQDTLVSGTNIKTIGSTSLLGSGSISLTKADVGLSNVDDTSDANKPISTATASALLGKEATIAKANGYLTWNGSTWVFKNDTYSVINDNTTSASTVWSSTKTSSELAAKGDVTLTGNQTLTNKTLTLPTINGYVESTYNLTGSSIDPNNGSVQYATLAANTTFSVTMNNGQSVTLMLNPGTSVVTWPSITWIATSSPTAPTLIPSVYNCITLFKVSNIIFGKFEGRA